MNTTRWLLVIFGLLLVAGIMDVAYYYPQMPDQVAIHFNGRGQVDGWASKPAFLVMNIVLAVVMVVIFPGALLLLPIIPNALINLPHKEYWLAPERAEYTREILSRFLMGIGNATVAFLILAMHLSMRANLLPRPELGPAFWIGLVLMLVVTLGLTIWLSVVFRLPNAAR